MITEVQWFGVTSVGSKSVPT